MSALRFAKDWVALPQAEQQSIVEGKQKHGAKRFSENICRCVYGCAYNFYTILKIDPYKLYK